MSSYNFRYELMQRGVLEPKDIGFVPDAYTCNQHLERENKCLQKELENYQLVAMYVFTVIKWFFCFLFCQNKAQLSPLNFI